MKNYIALVSVVGSMMMAGCAGSVPTSQAPAGTTSLTGADVAMANELEPSPYTRATPTWLTEDPWAPVAPSPPAAMPNDDPWAEAPMAAGAPVTRTWGSAAPVEYGF